ncbi:MAG: hypothetical protein CL866_03615 [Cycloclasticus sp.]|nr:hypothetical protein [Cycloclasticus sp.]MBG95943.1 hypothetical protein [Cycloclasticus sp.]HAI97700.1 hypothetical protein [Methylococcaceae bacterium]
MHSAGLMYTIAQIAVALAGFSAIIVALNQKPVREWDLADQVNIRLLIQLSIAVIFFSLLPSLLSIFLKRNDIWLCSLWAYGLIHFLDAGFFLYFKSKHAPNIFRIAASCGVTLALVQMAIAGLGNDVARESVYVFTLIWHIGIIFMAFILLLYQVRDVEDETNNKGEPK